MLNPEVLGLSLIRIERDGVSLPGYGIEISDGEQVSNLRLITAYGALSLRGEIKIIGETPPPDLTLLVIASRMDNTAGTLRAYYVDARNHFLIDHLSPGEYELRFIFRGNQPGTLMMSPQLLKKVMELRQKVVVGGNNQPPVTMTIDLSRAN